MGVDQWWNNWGCCCGGACITGGCPNSTYQETPTGSQTEAGHGGPCAFIDLQDAPGGWGAAVKLTFKRTDGSLFAHNYGYPLIPKFQKSVTEKVSVTEGAGTGETPAYDHAKKGACQYLCYIEDGGGNIHSAPGDDSYIKMTRKADGRIQMTVRFQPTSGPHWTDQKVGTGSVARHFVTGKEWKKDDAHEDGGTWEDFTCSGADCYADDGGRDFTYLYASKNSELYKGCCGNVNSGSGNAGGISGSTGGGAAH